MAEYRRPEVTIVEYRDATGEPIPYGSRYWTIDVEPPSEVYSTCEHPERFEPVEVVGHGLVDFLTANYAVDRTDSTQDGRAQTVLVPKSGGGASLTFTFGKATAPQVQVRAGWRYMGEWPDCGCDACDDDVPGLMDELEDTVLTIVEGGMSEWRTGPDPSRHLYVDDAGNPIGDDHIQWEAHLAFDGPRENTSGSGGGWSRGEPEPVEMPLEPFRWPAWPAA